MKENNNISNYQQLLAITSSIILGGMIANHNRLGNPTSSSILVAKRAATEILDSILEQEE